jgi:predicted Zn-dependent peptidase
MSMNKLDRTVAPAVTGFGTLSIPECRVMTLDNGLKLHVMDQGAQEVCSLTCVWNGGNVEAPSPTVANLVVNLIREDSATHSGEQIADIIDFNGARLFGSITSHYTVNKLYTLNSKVGELLPLMTELFTSAKMPEQAFEMMREKSAKSLEIAQNKVEYWATQAINRLTMGADHPLAFVETPETIRSITNDEVKGWYNKVYSPETGANFDIFLAGRITPQIEDAVNRTLGALKADVDGGVKRIIKPFSPTIGATEQIKVDGALQSAVRMSMPAIMRNNPDYIALRLLIVALGGYFGSRLISNIREDKGLTYGISSFLFGYEEGGMIGISSSTDNANVPLLIAETQKEIARLLDGDFSDDEIDRLRQFSMSSLASTLDSPFEIMDYYVNNMTAAIPDGYFADQVATVQRLNRDMLTEVARKYIKPENITTVVAGG